MLLLELNGQYEPLYMRPFGGGGWARNKFFSLPSSLCYLTPLMDMLVGKKKQVF